MAVPIEELLTKVKEATRNYPRGSWSLMKDLAAALRVMLEANEVARQDLVSTRARLESAEEALRKVAVCLDCEGEPDPECGCIECGSTGIDHGAARAHFAAYPEPVKEDT